MKKEKVNSLVIISIISGLFLGGAVLYFIFSPTAFDESFKHTFVPGALLIFSFVFFSTSIGENNKSKEIKVVQLNKINDELDPELENEEKITKKEGSTFIEWYIQKQKEELKRHPEMKDSFFDLLKNRPEIMLNIILANLEEDVAMACISGKLANPIIFIHDSHVHAREVLEAFRKEFIV